ncbi:hypothetical protein BM1_10748 [Bipolaris maydis]|nr:hypothetical protein BM1_10748 [Bipolaris maydis]
MTKAKLLYSLLLKCSIRNSLKERKKEREKKKKKKKKKRKTKRSVVPMLTWKVPKTPDPAFNLSTNPNALI